jgi:hypothetical protein
LSHRVIGYYELKQYEPWFDEECSELLHLRKQAKLHWNKKKGYLKEEVNG